MANLAFSNKVAIKYLFSKRSEAFINIISIIAVLGVAIGVMVLIITMAIMSGFEHELKKKVVGNAHIIISNIGGRIDNWEDIEKEINTFSDIKNISPFTQHQVILNTNNQTNGMIIKGVDTKKDTEVSTYLDEGSNLEDIFSKKPSYENEDSELPGIILGKELTKKVPLFIGSAISLLTSNFSSSPFGLIPKYKRFRVSAIYSSGLTGYEESLAYIDLKDAQKLFKMNNAVTGIEIKLNKIETAPNISKEIESKLEGKGFLIQDWTKLNSELWEAIKLEKKVYFIVLLLLVVMASFSIVTTLVLIVMEKRKDIAVLRTLGAKSKDISNIFKLQGSIIGLAGTSFGIILGLLGCYLLTKYGFPLPENVFPTSVVPIKVNFFNVALIAISSFTICFLATVYPAYRASSFKPSNILRYE